MFDNNDNNSSYGEGDPLGTAQETKILPYWLIVYAQTRICPREWDA